MTQDFPDGIGPHEGRELDLMLSGDKPLAMFSDIVSSGFEWPDEQFDPYVTSGALVKKEFRTNTPDGRFQVRHLYFALPDEAWRIEEAHDLSCRHFDAWNAEAEEACVKLGRLLGYAEGDIQAFVSWSNRNRATQR